jgi:hypothetical protein
LMLVGGVQLCVRLMDFLRQYCMVSEQFLQPFWIQNIAIKFDHKNGFEYIFHVLK